MLTDLMATMTRLRCLILMLWLVQLCKSCLVCVHSLPSMRTIQQHQQSSSFVTAAWTRLADKQPALALGAVIISRVMVDRVRVDKDETARDDKASTDAPDSSDESTGAMSSAMIASIGFYKNFISPLLPPACRFLPTCSQYGVQAIKEFGPTKGCILTAWRLMRCSPIGGRGYDPPRWPPVSFTYSSY